jgi:hypothetical protein
MFGIENWMVWKINHVCDMPVCISTLHIMFLNYICRQRKKHRTLATIKCKLIYNYFFLCPPSINGSICFKQKKQISCGGPLKNSFLPCQLSILYIPPNLYFSVEWQCNFLRNKIRGGGATLQQIGRNVLQASKFVRNIK